MSGDLSSSSQCFGLYDNDKIIGFMAVIHQPNPVNKKIKRVHRVVISPDYQGIGLGTKFLNVIGQYYHSLGFNFSIMTSAKNMISGLERNSHWVKTRAGRVQKLGKTSAIKALTSTNRDNVFSTTFFYK